MEQEPKIQVWATSKNGQGFVQSLGIYNNIEDILIRTEHFASDVEITFEYVFNDKIS